MGKSHNALIFIDYSWNIMHFKNLHTFLQLRKTFLYYVFYMSSIAFLCPFPLFLERGSRGSQICAPHSHFHFLLGCILREEWIGRQLGKEEPGRAVQVTL